MYVRSFKLKVRDLKPKSLSQRLKLEFPP
jgi:hypothetical protein